MTEEEWFASADAGALLRHLGREPSDRKARLVSCLCLRLVWDALVDARSRRAVEVAELFAEGDATEYQRMVAEANADAAEANARQQGRTTREYFRAIAAKMGVLKKINAVGVYHFVAMHAPDRARIGAEVSPLLRDIVGNPFRRVTLAPAWRTSTVLALAQGAYESRDFSVMPILADALQDAGCDSDDILNHCRDPHATHVRGCWVVDLVLGKS